MFSIKRKLVRRIHQNQTCSNIRRDNATANNSVVLFATAVKLPCDLKQFEELAGGSPILRICRNGDHVRSVITVLHSPWGLYSRPDGNQNSLDFLQAESEAVPIRADGFQGYCESCLRESHLWHPKTAPFHAPRYGRDIPAGRAALSPSLP